MNLSSVAIKIFSSPVILGGVSGALNEGSLCPTITSSDDNWVVSPDDCAPEKCCENCVNTSAPRPAFSREICERATQDGHHRNLEIPEMTTKRSANALSRRDLLRLTAAGCVGFSMSGWLERMAAATAKDPQRKRACILLWMN